VILDLPEKRNPADLRASQKIVFFLCGTVSSQAQHHVAFLLIAEVNLQFSLIPVLGTTVPLLALLTGDCDASQLWVIDGRSLKRAVGPSVFAKVVGRMRAFGFCRVPARLINGDCLPCSDIELRDETFTLLRFFVGSLLMLHDCDYLLLESDLRKPSTSDSKSRVYVALFMTDGWQCYYGN
jgi:hypothetical protein